MSNKPFDLSFIPAAQLESNLSGALASIGQNLKHQKLQELAARVQGYPTLNHRSSADIERSEVSFLVTSITSESGVSTDIAPLDIHYALVTFRREHLDKIRHALAAAAMLDEWAQLSTFACSLSGYRAPNNDVNLHDCSAIRRALEEGVDMFDEPLYVRTEDDMVTVSPGLGQCLWVTGREKHGYPFSTPRLQLAELEEAFRSGRLDDNAEWIVIPDSTEQN